MKASYALVPLLLEEMAALDGFTQMATITAGDLTVTANNTAQVLTLGPIAAGAAVLVELRVRTALENTADAAFNSNTVSVGDDNSATSLLAATQTNKNGTVVPVARGTLSSVYAADTWLKVTVNSMASKALNSLNKGELQLFVKIINPKPLGNLKTMASINK